jgi:hypothetical protein
MRCGARVWGSGGATTGGGGRCMEERSSDSPYFWQSIPTRENVVKIVTVTPYFLGRVRDGHAIELFVLIFGNRLIFGDRPWLLKIK